LENAKVFLMDFRAIDRKLFFLEKSINSLIAILHLRDKLSYYKKRKEINGAVKKAIKPRQPRQRMATCHPNELNFYNGKCKRCYHAGWRNRKKQNAICHPTKASYRRGFCRTCYDQILLNNYSVAIQGELF
jgi:hypothetical protein